ncbi:unnamed protein product [Rhizopus stolonifer]
MNSLAGHMPTHILQYFPPLRIFSLEVKDVYIVPFYEALNTCCLYLELLELYIIGKVYETSFISVIRLPLQIRKTESIRFVSTSNLHPLFSSNRLEVLTIIGLNDIKDVLKPSTLSRLRSIVLQNILDLETEGFAPMI